MLGDELRFALAETLAEIRERTETVMQGDALVNAAREVLGGNGGGPPAMRTGAYRDSWHALPVEVAEDTVTAAIATILPERAVALEYGTSRMKPHPHMEQISEIAAETLLRELEES